MNNKNKKSKFIVKQSQGLEGLKDALDQIYEEAKEFFSHISEEEELILKEFPITAVMKKRMNAFRKEAKKRSDEFSAYLIGSKKEFWAKIAEEIGESPSAHLHWNDEKKVIEVYAPSQEEINTYAKA